ncbi:MAG TPA: SMI1/KNR4 family protein [Gallionellaceae bacterium]
MGIFAAFRALNETRKTLKKSAKEEDALRALPMAEFLPRWAGLLSGATGGGPVFHKAAAHADLDLAEQRLGWPLPPELREFYLNANGIDWPMEGYRKNLPSASEIRLSSAYVPALSAQLLDSWQSWGRDEGEPKGIKVFSTSLLDLMADRYECVIPFSEVDGMLSLDAPESGDGAVLVVNSNRHFPIGTVLEVENLTATRYDGIRQWLASGTGTIAGISALANRAA